MVNLKNFRDFIQNGVNASNDMSNYSTNAINNPSDFFNNLMQNYQNSSLFTQKYNDMTNLANNRNMANGKYGSMQTEQDINRNTQNLLNEDIQQYINNLLGIQNTGLNVAQNLANTGANMTTNQANLQFQQEQADKEKNNFWSNLLRALGTSAVVSGYNSVASPAFAGLTDAMRNQFGVSRESLADTYNMNNFSKNNIKKIS